MEKHETLKREKEQEKLWLWIVGSLLAIFDFYRYCLLYHPKTMNKINTPLIQTTDAAQPEEKQ